MCELIYRNALVCVLRALMPLFRANLVSVGGDKTILRNLSSLCYLPC